MSEAHDLPERAWATLSVSGSLPPGVTETVIRGALDASVEAGELHLRLLGKIARGAVKTKSSQRDLVTEADVGAERIIVGHLRKAAPGHAIEAEEETMDAAGEGLRWFVDPLDGTVNFVHGIPSFCVSLGLYDGIEPLFSVVHAPRLRETFVAAKGAGAWLFDGDGSGAVRLGISAAQGLDEAILATGFPYRRGELEHSNLENFGRFFYDIRGVRRMGSAALDLAYVAAGRLDAYWELHLSPHDVAGGALLVREAGGEVTDADGGEDWLRGGHVVAGPVSLTGEMRSRIEH